MAALLNQLTERNLVESFFTCQGHELLFSLEGQEILVKNIKMGEVEDEDFWNDANIRHALENITSDDVVIR